MTIQQVVAKKLKLYARRRAVTLLDGNYDSVFKGKGIELESLRPYVQGDSVKDIDWKSTARTGNVQTRLYTPLRDQRILVVIDCTSSMLLPSRSGMDKKDALYGVIVTLGMFVNKNRDVIASCIGRPDGSINVGRFGNNNNHIEKILRNVDQSLQEGLRGRPPSMYSMLDRLKSSMKQRTAIFIVSDSTEDQSELKPVLSKLGVKHQLFWMQIDPSSPFVKNPPYNQQIIDIDSKHPINGSSMSKLLHSEWETEISKLSDTRRRVCKSTGVAYGETYETDQLLPEMRKMFIQARNYAKRH